MSPPGNAKRPPMAGPEGAHKISGQGSTESIHRDGCLLTLAEAREITMKINIVVDDLGLLIVAAYTGKVWLALGHDSWNDYCGNEINATHVRLPREERREHAQHQRQG